MQNHIIEPINVFEISEENDKELCSICLDEMNIPESIYKIESCNHCFHSKCILEMFINGINEFCPLCRSYITTTNNNYDYDSFKFNLIQKYAKKKNSNKIVVNLFKKYDKCDSSLKLLIKEKKQINRNISLVKKNNKDIIRKNIENRCLERRIKCFLKNNKNIIKTDWRNKRSPIFVRKIIKENIKECNTNMSSIFNEKLIELNLQFEEYKNNDCIKEYDKLNKILSKINIKIIKKRREKNDIKRSILQIPIAAPVKI